MVALTLMMGCYSPTLRDCEITCTGGVCPSGLECRDNVCRSPDETRTCSEILGGGGGDASIDGSSTADTDGDRVMDDVDNCPGVFNVDQYDEDGDALGDACDPCPIAAPVGAAPADVDVDGDRVGDACDPNPTTAGDQILLFEPFNTAPAGAVASGIAYTISGGEAAIATSTSEYGNYALTVPGFDSARTTYVTASMQLIAYLTSTTGTDAGLFMTSDPAASSGKICVLSEEPSNLQMLLIGESTPASDSSVASQPAVAPAGTVAQLSMFRSPNTSTYHCASSAASNSVTGDLPASSNGATLVGVHARSARAAFRYLFVVDSPFTPTP